MNVFINDTIEDCFHRRYKMNNKDICRKTDEHFTKGKEYECTKVYVRYETPMVDIMDDNGELIQVDINDKDFQFILNFKR